MLLTIIIVVILVGVLWGGWGGPHYRPTWGYGGYWSPLVVLLLVVLLLYLTGVLR